MTKYFNNIVYEKTNSGYSAYVKNLPGCIAAGKTLKQTEKLIKEAIIFHLEVIDKS